MTKVLLISAVILLLLTVSPSQVMPAFRALMTSPAGKSGPSLEESLNTRNPFVLTLNLAL